MSSPPNSNLNIAILGAGIAGLSTALAISKARPNTKITVYESHSSLSPFGAGLQLSANATRILSSTLDLAPQLAKVANEPSIMQVRRYADDAVIGEIAQNPQSGWEYEGWPHWQVYRPDLVAALAEGCQREGGVKVVFGKRAVKVDADRGTVDFEDGEVVEMDLVIGADGLRGKTRRWISENEGIEAKAFSEFCFRAVVPKQRMNEFEMTKELMQGGNLNMVWCGPGICMLGYPVHGGELYNIVLSVPRPADAEAVGKWSQAGEVGEGAALLEGFCERARKVWSLVGECAKWTLGDLPPLPTFISRSGKLVLVGDCAHAILPHSGQGACMALEDAASLAVFVAAIDEREELPRMMEAWDEVRQERMAGIRSYAAGNQQFLTMPDGPAQEKRDQLWAAMMAAWKKELQDLGEQGVKDKPQVKPAPPSKENQDMRSRETRMYVFGYDAAGVAERMVSQVKNNNKS